MLDKVEISPAVRNGVRHGQINATVELRVLQESTGVAFVVTNKAGTKHSKVMALQGQLQSYD